MRSARDVSISTPSASCILPTLYDHEKVRKVKSGAAALTEIANYPTLSRGVRALVRALHTPSSSYSTDVRRKLDSTKCFSLCRQLRLVNDSLTETGTHADSFPRTPVSGRFCWAARYSSIRLDRSMTAAVASRQPLLPANLSSIPAPASCSQRSDSLSTDSRPSQTASSKTSRARKERPCDACRRKKSRCVLNEGQPLSCVACSAHGHQCTFVEDPRPRKRRLDTDGKDSNLSKRRLAFPIRYGRSARLTSMAVGPSSTCSLKATPKAP